MFGKQHKLDVSAEELALIEAALHTQSKILNVQASAGGSNARARLNEVKQVLARLAQQKPAEPQTSSRWGFSWFGTTRTSG